jgi:5'-3' exonuclease
LLALIDGDVIKYSCGFASDANAKSRGESHEDLSFCLQGVRKTIDSIVTITGADDYVVFVSHPVNRRVAAFPDYKANRDPLHKPYWFKEIHEYLFDKHYGTYSDEGDEADDAMGVVQCRDLDNSIICTIDKDLDGVPGWHYNFSKNRKADGVYNITEVEANRFFYKQILSGDSTDNIPGMFRKLGIMATSKYKAPLDKMTRTADMYSHVVDCYKGDEEFVKFVGDLLFIKRDETGIWQPK